MKKNCNVIKDLLPLYLDKACSLESKELVEEHLSNCANCQKYLDELKDNIVLTKTNEETILKKIKQKLNLKIIRNSLLITFSILLVAFIILRFWSFYEFTEKKPKDLRTLINVNAFKKEQWNFQFISKEVGGRMFATTRVMEENGEDVTYIFLNLKSTLQEHLEKSISIPDIPYEDISLNGKVKVYYTTTDLNQIKEMSYQELNDIIKTSDLIATNEILKEEINCELNNQNYSLLLDYYKGSKQIIKSEGDETFPKDLLKTVYSIDGTYQSIWALDLFTDELFTKINDFMTKNGGSCVVREVNE